MKATLLAHFLRHPKSTGSICPSSLSLANELVREVGIEHAQAVAELGPGTGAITGTILKSISSDSDFFAVELNSDILNTFKVAFPDVKVYNDSAANLKHLVQLEGVAGLDVVISSLPWAVFPEDLQRAILSAVAESLLSNGHFTTFAYLQGMLLPSAVRFKKLLTEYFSKVERSKVIWKNFPPAFVYRCTK